MNLTFSFGGAFVFGMVINFLSDAINARVEGLKKGKSKVVEAGHTLILGWNDRILPLVEQVPIDSLLRGACSADTAAGVSVFRPFVVLWLADLPGQYIRRRYAYSDPG